MKGTPHPTPLAKFFGKKILGWRAKFFILKILGQILCFLRLGHAKKRQSSAT